MAPLWMLYFVIITFIFKVKYFLVMHLRQKKRRYQICLDPHGFLYRVALVIFTPLIVQVAMEALLALFSLVETVVAIWSSAICCRVACCCRCCRAQVIKSTSCFLSLDLLILTRRQSVTSLIPVITAGSYMTFSFYGPAPLTNLRHFKIT